MYLIYQLNYLGFSFLKDCPFLSDIYIIRKGTFIAEITIDLCIVIERYGVRRRRNMPRRGRVMFLSMILLISIGSMTQPALGETARFREGDLITGIVDKVDGDLLTVDGGVYDTKNVQIRFIEGTSPVDKRFLRGKRAQILIRSGYINHVLILPVIGQ